MTAPRSEASARAGAEANSAHDKRHDKGHDKGKSQPPSAHPRRVAVKPEAVVFTLRYKVESKRARLGTCLVSLLEQQLVALRCTSLGST